MQKNTGKSLLERLYDSELFPAGGVGADNPQTRDACRRAEQVSSYLMSRLDDQDRPRLDELIDILGERDSYTAYDNFAFGFRLGARLMLEATSGTL